jgi:hypothetical protein
VRDGVLLESGLKRIGLTGTETDGGQHAETATGEKRTLADILCRADDVLEKVGEAVQRCCDTLSRSAGEVYAVPISSG